MNNFLKIALPFAAVTAAAAATVFMTAPGKATEEQKAPFFGRNFAHRGLHKQDKTVPENSLPAFERAIQEGYGIELDVHITADDRIVVMHDRVLGRACGVDRAVTECFWEEIKGMTLFGTAEHVPLLSDALYLIAGRCPVIIELKNDERRRELCERTLELVRTYNGDVCIESFDPFILGWFRKNAPDILRGQLSRHPSGFGHDVPRTQAFALGNLLTNFIARPQFIAYAIGKKPLTVRLCEALGAMRVAWTSRDWTHEAKNDAVIFEFYHPEPRFK